MATTRTLHYTEQPVGNQMRRTIGNNINYFTAAGGWNPTAVAVVAASGTPTGWAGQTPFPFTHHNLTNPLQVFLGDSTDAANTALMGMRLASDPTSGVLFKPLNVQTVTPTIAGSAMTWTNLWTQSDLTYTINPGRVDKLIKLKATGHPANFRFVYQLHPGCTAAINNGQLEIFNAAAQRVFVVRKPFGFDSSSPPKPVRVAFATAADVSYNGGTYPTFTLTPNVSDLSTATYPVYLDPTTTISGTTAITDTLMITGGALDDANYGSFGSWVIGDTVAGAVIRRLLLKCASTSIPTAAVSAFRAKFTQTQSATSTATQVMNAYQVKPANDWVEGTAGGTTETGSADWNHVKHATQSWAGSAGCSTSGTDYVTDAAPPTFTAQINTVAPDVLLTLTLPTDWAHNWAYGTVTNNGMMIKAATEATSKIYAFFSSESGTTPPTFEVDSVAWPIMHHAGTLTRKRR